MKNFIFKNLVILSSALLTLVCACITPGGNSKSVKDDFLRSTDEQKIIDVIKSHSETPINEYKLLRAPSYPQKIIKIIPEWETSNSLIISIPGYDIFNNYSLAVYYMDIIKNAILYTNVMILVDEEELFTLQEIIQLLEANDLDKYLKESSRYKISILSVNLDTLWVRDYGPVFGISEDNSICLLDSIYDDVREKLQDTKYVDFSRIHDDRISIYLLNYFSNLYKSNIKVIRSPIQLWGGDFYSDGKGTMFTSTETLAMNGGNVEEFNLILKYYYGINEVVYLTPLPGKTIKHIDMFFKIVDENTILLDEYIPAKNTNNTYIQFLESEIKRVLDENFNILKSKFPEKKIIRIPMPQINYQLKQELKTEIIDSIFDSYQDDSSFLISVFFDIYLNKDIFKKYIWHNYSKKEVIPILNDEDRISDFMDEFNAFDSDEYQEFYISTIADDFDNFLRIIGNDKSIILDALEVQPDAFDYFYNTYLNNIYINGKERDVLLVPGYLKSKSLEKEVKKKLEEAYKNTDIVFINSDEIIKMYGAIHCSTLLLPEIKL